MDREGLELSPRKVEYLKYLFEQGTSVKTNNLATHFGVDPSTITKTISELAESGYIIHTPYHGVSLSGVRETLHGISLKTTPDTFPHADSLWSFR